MAALQTSGPRATAVIEALGSGEGELLPFVPRGATGAAAKSAHDIGAALEPALVPLARHPDASIRTKALVLVARSPSEAATAAVVAGLEDASEAVQRVALSAVSAPRVDGTRAPANEVAARAVAHILATHESWAIRVLAAQALGRLGAAGLTTAGAQLEQAAAADGYALVREAALQALASFDVARARAVAEPLATRDPEPRVQALARTVLGR
jgi:HEAT repeat protein